MDRFEYLNKCFYALSSKKLKATTVMTNRIEFLSDLEEWHHQYEINNRSQEFLELTHKLFSIVYFAPPDCFEGEIEDLNMEKRVTKLENENINIKKDFAKLLKAFDELRNNIIISDKTKGQGLSALG